MADKLRFMTVGERLGQNRKSEYLGAEDIDSGAEPVLTIDGAWDGTITTQKGKEFAEGIAFKETSVPGILNVRPWIVNATNRKTLKKLFGSTKQEDIAGKKIQLYVDHNVRDPQTGGKCDGIRVRPFIPKETEPVPPCTDCKCAIPAANGKSPKYLADYTTKHYGVPLCAACAAKRKAVQQDETVGAEEAETAPEVEGATDADE